MEKLARVSPSNDPIGTLLICWYSSSLYKNNPLIALKIIITKMFFKHFFTKVLENYFYKNDLISLLTNVPSAETIELIASYVYAKDNPSYSPFNKDIFSKNNV